MGNTQVDVPSAPEPGFIEGLRVYHAIFLPLAVPFNFFVMWVMLRDAKLRAQRSVLLLTLLAIGDSGTGICVGMLVCFRPCLRLHISSVCCVLCTGLIHIWNLAGGGWLSPGSDRFGCGFVTMTSVCFCSGSLFLMAIIAVERYLLVIKRYVLPIRKLIALNAMCWVSHSALSLLPSFFFPLSHWCLPSLPHTDHCFFLGCGPSVWYVALPKRAIKAKSASY
jgi:hypothetical protein